MTPCHNILFFVSKVFGRLFQKVGKEKEIRAGCGKEQQSPLRWYPWGYQDGKHQQRQTQIGRQYLLP